MPASSDATILLSNTDDSTLCDYGWKIALENQQKIVRFVRGNKMRTVHALFNEVSSACQFPYYFGENWDAFKECLGDLSWLNCAGFLLIVTHADEVLIEDPAEIGSLARTLRGAINEFNEQVNLPENFRKSRSRFQILMNGSSLLDGISRRLVDDVGLTSAKLTL
jgi:hypothetical protein